MKNRQVFSKATQTRDEMEKPRCDFTRAMWCNNDENDLSVWVWIGKEKYLCAADSARAQEALWYEEQNALLIEWPDASEVSLVSPSTTPSMPADLAALALPDESLADLKVRLLTELTRLRSMAVGRLDMTDAERAMLTTLEGQVAQQWFSS